MHRRGHVPGLRCRLSRREVMSMIAVGGSSMHRPSSSRILCIVQYCTILDNIIVPYHNILLWCSGPRTDDEYFSTIHLPPPPPHPNNSYFWKDATLYYYHNDKMGGGLAFLTKKSFNPANWSNQKQVWEARQKEGIEKRRVAERDAQLRREREEEELARAVGGEEGGGRKALSFMYDAGRVPGLERRGGCGDGGIGIGEGDDGGGGCDGEGWRLDREGGRRGGRGRRSTNGSRGTTMRPPPFGRCSRGGRRWPTKNVRRRPHHRPPRRRRERRERPVGLGRAPPTRRRATRTRTPPTRPGTKITARTSRRRSDGASTPDRASPSLSRWNGSRCSRARRGCCRSPPGAGAAVPTGKKRRPRTTFNP